MQKQERQRTVSLAFYDYMRKRAMNKKMKIKMSIDLLMTVCLLFLMAFQITGEALHEWIGAGMLILFLLHNFLNVRWYGNLLKGKYNALRVFRTFVNLMVLVSMLVQAYSGIVLSRHVFAFLPINSGMAIARVFHLAGAYWGFVLMSIHLGLHGGMIMGRFRKMSGQKQSVIRNILLRMGAAAIALYGAVCFISADVPSYMFLKVEFAFFDYDKSAVQVFAEYIVMMGTWIWLSYYISKWLIRISVHK